VIVAAHVWLTRLRADEERSGLTVGGRTGRQATVGQRAGIGATVTPGFAIAVIFRCHSAAVVRLGSALHGEPVGEYSAAIWSTTSSLPRCGSAVRRRGLSRVASNTSRVLPLESREDVLRALAGAAVEARPDLVTEGVHGCALDALLLRHQPELPHWSAGGSAALPRLTMVGILSKNHRRATDGYTDNARK
jgi:hypothetical protein